VSDFSQVINYYNHSEIGNVSVTASNYCHVRLYMKSHCRVYSYISFWKPVPTIHVCENNSGDNKIVINR
jgi:hypothetical protein